MKRQFVLGLAMLSIVTAAVGCRENEDGGRSFRVFTDPPPLVTSVTSSTNTNGVPSVTGNGTGNSTFQMTGSNLGAVVAVEVGGVRASFSLNAAGDTITVTVPSGIQGGNQSIVLITSGGNNVPAGTILVLAQTHLLITEIGNGGGSANNFEFVEIFNPTQGNINLSNVYLTDGTNESTSDFYYNVTLGGTAAENACWSGFSSDFICRFPNVNIAAGQYITVTVFDAAAGGTAGGGSGNVFFFDTFGRDPDFEMVSGGDGDSIADMVNLQNSNGFANSSIGTSSGFTSSSTGEVCVLFQWDGVNPLVQDLDYIIFGSTNTGTGREAVSKTGVTVTNGTGTATYRADTTLASQMPLQNINNSTLGGVPITSQRVSLSELGETLTGGNGVTGHNETSENLPASFQSTVFPASPGLPYPADPRSAESNVSRSTNISYQFYRPVSGNTPVDNTRFTVTQGGSMVAGTVSFDSTTNTVTFTPDSTLMANTTYTVTLDSSIQRDDNFFFFVSDRSYQFTTGS